MHSLWLEAELFRVFDEEGTISLARRIPECVAQKRTRDGDRPAVAVQHHAVGTHDRCTEVHAAACGEVFRAKTRSHLTNLLLHVGAFTVTRLQRLRIGGILREILRAVRCHERQSLHETIAYGNLLAAVRHDVRVPACCTLELGSGKVRLNRSRLRLYWIFLKLAARPLLLGNHASHDGFHLGRSLAACSLERLIDTFEELLELQENALQDARRSFARLKVTLEAACETLLLPLTLELPALDHIAALLRRKNRLLALGKLLLPRRVLVLLRLSFLPRRPVSHRFKVFGARLVESRNVFQIHEEHVPHLMEKCGFIRLLEEGDNTPAARLRRDRALAYAVHALVELIDDINCFIIKNNEAATVLHPLVSNALDAVLV